MPSNRFEQLSNLLKESPDDPFLIFALAKEFEKQENYDQAIQYYQNLVENHANETGTYYHFGKLLEALDQEEKALEIYENGIVICQKNKDLHALAELKGAKLNLELGL